MDSATGAVVIGRIRRAGLGRVKDAARKDGRTAEQIERETRILRDVGLWSVFRAMRIHHCSRETVSAILERYGAYAQSILDNNSRQRPG